MYKYSINLSRFMSLRLTKLFFLILAPEILQRPLEEGDVTKTDIKTDGEGI